jgi:hypothetical protein
MRQLLLLWSPRILGLALGAFLTLFAFDGFQQGKPFGAAFAEFAIHLIAPAVVVAIVVLSWRRAWLGGIGFVLLATLYAVSAWSRPDWILAISGPLLAIGVLFLLSWANYRELGTHGSEV